LAKETTPLILGADLKVTTDYLVNTLGFKLDRIIDGDSTVVLAYRGSRLMLKAVDTPENFREILMKVENIEEIYKKALSGGAIIRRYLECTEKKDGSGDRRFTVSLPEGNYVTFFSPTGVAECGRYR